jgi:RNA polymerase sigma-70 factor, ECF subfamily
MTDADLIRCEILLLRCQRRDPGAATELVGLFDKPLLYYLRRLTGSEDDAWDLLQETWISAFRSLPRLRDSRAFPSYLYRTARNCALVYLRRRGAERLLITNDAEVPQAAVEIEPSFTPEDAAAVHAGLEKLSPAHREVLTLFFLQDLGIDQIASVLEIPPGTVKSRLHHAKRGLAAILKQGDDHVH